MKRLILIVAGISVTSLTWAQKQNIQTASNYLNDKDYDKAVEYINMATTDPSTKDNAKAWYVKGRIYLAMQAEPSKKASMPYREAGNAYTKVTQLDAKYEKEEVTQALMVVAYNYYNDAAGKFNEANKAKDPAKYDEAYTLAKGTVDIHNLDEGKRYAGNKSFDTVASQALMIQTFSAYYAKKYDEALPGLMAMKNDPINKNANVYLALSDIYKLQNKDAEMLAVLEEARKQYPDNKSIRNEELNYYIKTGKQDILLKKLEEAVTADGNNAELQYNLANAYTELAFPKTDVKPANYADLIGKAEIAYTKALAIEAENGGYLYNSGVLYYSQAVDFNKQMNVEGELANKSKVTADRKKHEDAYNQLMAKRDAMFDKSMPYFEKAVSSLEKGAMNGEDKGTYLNSMIALKEIYARRNMVDKSNEMKKKIEESRKK